MRNNVQKTHEDFRMETALLERSVFWRKKKEGVLKDKNHTRTTMEQQCASCSTRDMQLGAYLVTYMKDGTYSTVQKGEHVLFTN